MYEPPKMEQPQYGGFSTPPPPSGAIPQQPPPGYSASQPPYMVMGPGYPQQYERTPEERQSVLTRLVWPLAILSCCCGGLFLGFFPLLFACEYDLQILYY